MSREFVPRITVDMLNEDGTIVDSIFNNPSFRTQIAEHVAQAIEDYKKSPELRAWAAEEMRGLVPVTYTGSHLSLLNEYESGHREACAETLANIERWEKSHG